MLAAFVLGTGALAGFTAWERRVRGPLIDVSLFTRPGFAAATLAALVVFFAFVSEIVYCSAYLRQDLDRTEVHPRPGPATEVGH